MERYAGNYIKNCHLFFILGASDDLAKNLKKTAIRAAMRVNSSVEYLVNMPIVDLIELVEEIVKSDEESKKQ